MPDPSIGEFGAAGGAMAVVLGAMKLAGKWFEGMLERRKERKVFDGPPPPAAGDWNEKTPITGTNVNSPLSSLKRLAAAARADREMQSQIVESIKNIAEIQRQTLKEMHEFRKENEKAHEHIESQLVQLLAKADR